MKTNAEKMQIKAGESVWVNAHELHDLLLPLPELATLCERPVDAAVMVMFVTSDNDIAELWRTEIAAMNAARVVWLCYRKAGVDGLHRDTIAQNVRARGWRPVAIVSIDESWSGLRIRLDSVPVA